MKTPLKSVLLVFFLLISAVTFSQVWEIVYDSINTMGRQVILTDDSCFLVTCTNNSFEDGLSLKLNQSGDIMWYSPFGGMAVTQTYDKDYIIASFHSSLNKIDGDGNQVWHKTYGGGKQEDLFSVIESSDTNIVACGFSHNHGDSTFLVMKTDRCGNLIWTKSFKSLSFGSLNAVIEFDYNYYVVGNESDSNGQHLTFFIAKLTMGGSLRWQKSYEIGFAGKSIAITRDSALIVAGDFWLTRLNLSGDTVWTKNIIYRIESVDVTSDNGYILSGRSGNNPPNNILTRFNSIGQKIWVHAYPSGMQQYMPAFSSVRSLADDGFITCGYSQYDDKAATKLRVLKTDETGNILVNISNPDTNNQTIIYPNPNNGRFIIKIEGITEIDIFDMNGRLVHRSINGNEIDLGNRENGIYIARVATEHGIFIQKILKK